MVDPVTLARAAVCVLIARVLAAMRAGTLLPCLWGATREIRFRLHEEPIMPQVTPAGQAGSVDGGQM